MTGSLSSISDALCSLDHLFEGDRLDGTCESLAISFRFGQHSRLYINNS